MDKLDVILFGASGFTGKYVIEQLHKFQDKLTWGIAGRNENKLQSALKKCVADSTNIPIILADVEDETSIRNMTARANLIINCCGPYDLYGEVVVKACIESATHYVDITGEIHFIYRMMLKYGSAAEEKGIYIVHACGYDSIPTDLGICFMENNFPGTINSIETYMGCYLEGGGEVSEICNYGTYASAVDIIGNLYKTYLLKQKFKNKKVPPFRPKLYPKLVGKVEGQWACFVPSADVDLVNHSQQYFYENANKRPVQMYNYALLTSFKYIVLSAILLFIIGFLAQFKFGRNFLLQHPKFFTYGMMTHTPSEDKIKRTHFFINLKGQGWSENLADARDEYHTPPNKEIVGRISGVNPGYGFTSLALVLSALMILTEIKNLPARGGVYSPAIAFSKTSLIKKLQDNGVVFEVVSIKDKL